MTIASPSRFLVADIGFASLNRQTVKSSNRQKPISARLIVSKVSLTTWHHFEKKASEIFGFRNCGQNRMIRRLLESAQTARRAPRIHQSVCDCLQKRLVIHVMRTGKRRKQTVFR